MPIGPMPSRRSVIIAGDDAVEPLAGFLGDKTVVPLCPLRAAEDGRPTGHRGPRPIARCAARRLTSRRDRHDRPPSGPDCRRAAGETPRRSRTPQPPTPPPWPWAVSERPTPPRHSPRRFAPRRTPRARQLLGSALLLAGQRLVKTGHAEEAVAVFDLLRAAPIPEPCRIAARKMPSSPAALRGST